MAPNAKRVFYVKYLSGPVFGEILAKRPDIQLDKLENETPNAEAEPVLSQAHAYQIGASRQVIGKHLQVTDALLAKTPNLVAVSSNGAGYDTIDVDACTRQGIIVVNQSGGNKEAVAEHALAMLLTLSKRIIEVDRRMRRAPGIPRNDYIGTELLDKTIGIIGIGNVGGRLAELCEGPVPHACAGLRPVSDRCADRREGCGESGDARRNAASGRLRIGERAVHARDQEHDGRARIRVDAEARIFRHHRARRYPR